MRSRPEEAARRERLERAERLDSGSVRRQFDEWMQRQGYSEERRAQEQQERARTVEHLRQGAD